MNPIDLDGPARKDAVARLQTWLRQELDQDIGGLQAEILLDLIARDLGPHFYNRGLRDAQAVFNAKAEDIADALYGLERQSSLR